MSHSHPSVVTGCTHRVTSLCDIHANFNKVGTVAVQLLLQVQTYYCLCSTHAREPISMQLSKECCVVWQGVIQQPMRIAIRSQLHVHERCDVHLATIMGVESTWIGQLLLCQLSCVCGILSYFHLQQHMFVLSCQHHRAQDICLQEMT